MSNCTRSGTVTALLLSGALLMSATASWAQSSGGGGVSSGGASGGGAGAAGGVAASPGGVTTGAAAVSPYSTAPTGPNGGPPVSATVPLGSSVSPNTTEVGKTKPPGAPLDGRGGLRPDLDRKERDIERTVTHSVCKTTSCL